MKYVVFQASRRGGRPYNEDRVAYAIPSPGRRQSRSWVLPTVPLLPAGAATAAAGRAAEG